MFIWQLPIISSVNSDMNNYVRRADTTPAIACCSSATSVWGLWYRWCSLVFRKKNNAFRLHYSIWGCSPDCLFVSKGTGFRLYRLQKNTYDKLFHHYETLPFQYVSIWPPLIVNIYIRKIFMFAGRTRPPAVVCCSSETAVWGRMVPVVQFHFLIKPVP